MRLATRDHLSEYKWKVYFPSIVFLTNYRTVVSLNLGLLTLVLALSALGILHLKLASYTPSFSFLFLNAPQHHGCWKVSVKDVNENRKLKLFRNKRLSKGKKGLKKRAQDTFTRKDWYSVKVAPLVPIIRVPLTYQGSIYISSSGVGKFRSRRVVR